MKQAETNFICQDLVEHNVQLFFTKLSSICITRKFRIRARW